MKESLHWWCPLCWWKDVIINTTTCETSRNQFYNTQAQLHKFICVYFPLVLRHIPLLSICQKLFCYRQCFWIFSQCHYCCTAHVWVFCEIKLEEKQFLQTGRVFFFLGNGAVQCSAVKQVKNNYAFDLCMWKSSICLFAYSAQSWNPITSCHWRHMETHSPPRCEHKHLDGPSCDQITQDEC